MRWAFLLWTLAVPILGQDSGEKWTEARVLGEFLRNPQLAALDARVAAVEAEGRVRALPFNPRLNYSREGAGFTEFLHLEQALPISGRLRLLREAGRAGSAVAEAEKATGVWLLRADVRLSFYRLLAAQERQTRLAESMQETGEVLRVLRVREKEGEGSRYDMIRVERELAEQQADLRLASAAVAEAQGRLAAYLAPPVRVTVVAGVLNPTAPLPTQDEISARALAQRADLRELDHRFSLFELEEKAARKLRVPEPVINAGIKRSTVGLNANETSYVAGLSIPLPAFNRGQFEVMRALAEQRAVSARRAALEIRIRAEIEAAHRSAVIRRDNLDAYRREVETAGGELLRITRVAYQEAEVGILELLDALRVQRLSSLRLIDLEAGVREAQIELERAAGVEVLP